MIHLHRIIQLQSSNQCIIIFDMHIITEYFRDLIDHFQHLVDMCSNWCSREGVLSYFFISIEVIKTLIVVVCTSFRTLCTLIQFIDEDFESVLLAGFYDAVKATSNDQVLPCTFSKTLSIHVKLHHFNGIVALLDLCVKLITKSKGRKNKNSHIRLLCLVRKLHC